MPRAKMMSSRSLQRILCAVLLVLLTTAESRSLRKQLSFLPLLSLSSSSSPSSSSSSSYVTHSRSRESTVTMVASSNSGGAAVEKTLSTWQICVCGALATACGDLAMHPVDTIKITQQTATGVAKGMIATAKDILLQKGVQGLYSGVLPYLVADGLSGAIKFATFEVTKTHLEKRLPEKYHSALKFVCAAGAMLACSVVLVPGEVIKTRLQAGVVSLSNH